jgi:hypothetical protein
MPTHLEAGRRSRHRSIAAGVILVRSAATACRDRQIIPSDQGDRPLTDRAAHYPEAMIDIPGSARKETSLECFNTSFDELQRLAAAMDREIIRVEKARLEGARASKRCRTRARAAL